MTQAEIRLLRFLHAEATREKWILYSTIRNTEALLPGDEKAISGLISKGLVEKAPGEDAYRVTNDGAKALLRRLG